MTTGRLLLVDDEEEFIEAFGLRLEVRGFDVEKATTGTEALAKAKEQVFDVAIVDLAMPGMDGIETLEHLRALDPLLQVIVLTGHSTSRRVDVALGLGAVDFVPKPANFQELLAKITTAIQTRQESEEQREKQ